jgi:hypothetical protein
MLNGLAKEERDGICSAFGTLLVDLADGLCNISPERNGDNLAVATSFPPILPKEFAIMIPPTSFKLSFVSAPALRKHLASANSRLWKRSTDPCVTAIFEINYSKTYWIR